MSDAIEDRKACHSWPCMSRSPRFYASMPEFRRICFSTVFRNTWSSSKHIVRCYHGLGQWTGQDGAVTVGFHIACPKHVAKRTTSTSASTMTRHWDGNKVIIRWPSGRKSVIALVSRRRRSRHFRKMLRSRMLNEQQGQIDERRHQSVVEPLVALMARENKGLPLSLLSAFAIPGFLERVTSSRLT